MYEYKRNKIYRSCFINVCWSTILTWYGYNNTIVCPRFTVSHCVCYFFAILNENTHTSTCQRGTMEYLKGIKFKEFFIDICHLFILWEIYRNQNRFFMKIYNGKCWQPLTFLRHSRYLAQFFKAIIWSVYTLINVGCNRKSP